MGQVGDCNFGGLKYYQSLKYPGPVNDRLSDSASTWGKHKRPQRCGGIAQNQTTSQMPVQVPRGGRLNRESERWAMETGLSQNNGQIRILIAEEQRIYGDSLRALLATEPDFTVVGVAHDGAAALRMCQEEKPDILLLNVVKVSGSDGMGLLDELHRLNIPVRSILLATSLSGPDLRRALLLGARGVVLKTSSTQALFDGIRGVMVGQYWIGADIGASMLGALRDNTPSTNNNAPKGAFGLTSREMEIVTTVVAGYSNAEIAKKYGISVQTVKHHVSSIFDRAGVSNRLELALFAINHRLVGDDS